MGPKGQFPALPLSPKSCPHLQGFPAAVGKGAQRVPLVTDLLAPRVYIV